MSVVVYGRTVDVNTRSINLRDGNITEITGLGPFANLQKLYLSDNQITEIQGLDTLVHLRELYLSGNKITEIQGLDALVHLHTLWLSNNQIINIAGLDTLIKLRQLYLFNNKIVNISGLDALVNLQELNLSNNKIVNISGLDALVNLQELNLSNNKITKIQGLTTLVKLEELYLSHNQITKIEGLDELSKLVILELSHNKIKKIEGLSRTPNLNVLDLSHNQITEVTIPETLRFVDELNLDYNNIHFIPDLPILDYIGASFEGNPIITSPQRKALEKQVARYRGQHSKKKQLAPPKEATQWMNICRDLDQNYRLEDLKKYARAANITLSIDGKPKTKRQLCADLARQFANTSRTPTRHQSGCKNDEDLFTQTFDDMDPRDYIKMPDGFCLSLDDLDGLAPDFIHPLTREKLPDAVINFYNQNIQRKTVHELGPVKGYVSAQQLAIRLADILNSTERKVNGKVQVVPGETKYFDVGRLLVDKSMIDEYRRVIKQQELIQELRLGDYFRIGAPVVEYYDAMVDSLKWTKEHRFDLLDTLKWLYIEVMK